MAAVNSKSCGRTSSAATIGGPIKKNKIFIFGNYQETRQLNGVALRAPVRIFEPPIPAGDRSTPAWQAALGAANCPAIIPAIRGLIPLLRFGQMQVACDGSNINPVSLAMLNLKLPNGQYYIPTNTGTPFHERLPEQPRHLSRGPIDHQYGLADQQQEHLLGQVFLHAESAGGSFQRTAAVRHSRQ